MKILGIETSCDETAIAVVDSNRNILMHEIYSQIKIHAKYGGVIPEVAARNHFEILPKMIETAIDLKSLDLKEIDGIAVTAGPGLIGGVIVGVMFAKGLASALNKPCIPINHLEGHALTARLTDPSLDFPYLLLLVSGGHCQILFAKSLGNYILLGSTKDDAVGEVFDKVAKMLGLSYPGGPIVEKLALSGDPKAYNFPKPFFRESHCDMSFSGLKTAVSRQIAKEDLLSDEIKANICASFQDTISTTLYDRLESAIKLCIQRNLYFSSVVIGGGVGANQHIYKTLLSLCNRYEKKLIVPPINLCTDNAAMISWAGIEKMIIGIDKNLDFAPKSKWAIGRYEIK
jgi:N6-L-threonylcarbamoyladenine synthase